jgi:hypothetical protein
MVQRQKEIIQGHEEIIHGHLLNGSEAKGNHSRLLTKWF